MLAATRADITAAAEAGEAGEHRNVDLLRSLVRVGTGRLADMKARIEDFARRGGTA